MDNLSKTHSLNMINFCLKIDGKLFLNRLRGVVIRKREQKEDTNDLLTYRYEHVTIVILLISQPKHMMWVLKRIVLVRRFVWAPATNVLN